MKKNYDIWFWLSLIIGIIGILMTIDGILKYGYDNYSIKTGFEILLLSFIFLLKSKINDIRG